MRCNECGVHCRRVSLFSGYNFTDTSVSTAEEKTLTYHRIVEAFRFAYAKRSRLGDPRYLNITEVTRKSTFILEKPQCFLSACVTDFVSLPSAHPEHDLRLLR